MNLERIFFETRQGRRRLKPQMAMLASVAGFIIFVLFVLALYQRNAASKPKLVTPFAARPKLPQQQLNYDIIKLDTISLGDYYKPSEPPAIIPTSRPEERTEVPAPQRGQTPPAAAAAKRTAPAAAPATQEFPSAPLPVPASGRSMIVHSTLESNQLSTTSALGLQSVLLKVMLPDQTPVTNNSLVLARVISEGRWGSIEIPRRAQLLGVATLQNNRVEIQFREIRINGVTRSCSGRAYDLKR
ncbi:MAG: hypothetical protein ONB49_11250, partial [candidate division KSB1 bacterium]|nr:hypothetical protein [candidate division KSB1 bacterium]